MCAKARTKIDYRSVELDGVRYVIVRESVFDRLCERANVEATPAPAAGQTPEAATDLDGSRWRKNSCGGDWLPGCRRRSWRGVRRAAGNAQPHRARPHHADFATIRKLVVAMDAAEQECAKDSIS